MSRAGPNGLARQKGQPFILRPFACPDVEKTFHGSCFVAQYPNKRFIFIARFEQTQKFCAAVPVYREAIHP